MSTKMSRNNNNIKTKDKDNEGNLIGDHNELLETWKQYINEFVEKMARIERR